MKKTVKQLLAVFIAVLTTSFLPFAAFSEGIGFDALLTGEFSSPVTVAFSSPEYGSLAQFGKERLDSLNRLAGHFGLEISLDGSESKTTVSVDSDAVYSMTERVSKDAVRTVYSFEPDAVYESVPQETETGFYGFLDRQFFLINRLTDQLYPVFEKAAEAFPDRTKTAAEKVKYKDYGTSVRKVTITFPSDFVKEQFPKALSGLADSEECGEFISGLLFSGMQKIVLCFDADGHIIRANYDGTAGLSEESMSRVSLSWRCLRSEDRRKDDITLKTPSVKGFDRYNLTYVRETVITEEGPHTASWDFQLDLKAGEEKKKIRYNADLSFSSGSLTGKAVYSEREDRKEDRITILPEIRKDQEDEYSGTLEIQRNSGKILISSVKTGIRISPYTPDEGSGTDAASGTGKGKYTEEELQSAMDSLLIRKLLTLPAEDLDFLNRDIPDDVWKSITQSLF